MSSRSTCVLVVAPPRSGSSALAGALHRLGVNMGAGRLQEADALNPGGYFEDLWWQRVTKEVVGERYEAQEPAQLNARNVGRYRALAQEGALNRFWGVKDPRLCWVAHLLWPIIGEYAEVKLVTCERPLGEMAASLHRHSQIAYAGQLAMTKRKARELAKSWTAARERRLEEWDGEYLAVDYGALLEDPHRAMWDAMEYIGFTPTWAEVESAAKWINGGMRTQGCEGCP